MFIHKASKQCIREWSHQRIDSFTIWADIWLLNHSNQWQNYVLERLHEYMINDVISWWIHGLTYTFIKYLIDSWIYDFTNAVGNEWTGSWLKVCRIPETWVTCYINCDQAHMRQTNEYSEYQGWWWQWEWNMPWLLQQHSHHQERAILSLLCFEPWLCVLGEVQAWGWGWVKVRVRVRSRWHRGSVLEFGLTLFLWDARLVGATFPVASSYGENVS